MTNNSKRSKWKISKGQLRDDGLEIFNSLSTKKTIQFIYLVGTGAQSEEGTVIVAHPTRVHHIVRTERRTGLRGKINNNSKKLINPRCAITRKKIPQIYARIWKEGCTMLMHPKTARI